MLSTGCESLWGLRALFTAADHKPETAALKAKQPRFGLGVWFVFLFLPFRYSAFTNPFHPIISLYIKIRCHTNHLATSQLESEYTAKALQKPKTNGSSL